MTPEIGKEYYVKCRITSINADKFFEITAKIGDKDASILTLHTEELIEITNTVEEKRVQCKCYELYIEKGFAYSSSGHFKTCMHYERPIDE